MFYINRIRYVLPFNDDFETFRVSFQMESVNKKTICESVHEMHFAVGPMSLPSFFVVFPSPPFLFYYVRLDRLSRVEITFIS